MRQSRTVQPRHVGEVHRLGNRAGHRADENEVKRAGGGQGRRTAAQPPPETVPLDLLIIDELGFVPLSPTGAELLFEIFSQRYECGSILVTTNLPFDEWTEVFGSEHLTGALLDRLTDDSYRLKRSRENAGLQASEEPDDVYLTLSLSPLAPRTLATPPAYGPGHRAGGTRFLRRSGTPSRRP